MEIERKRDQILITKKRTAEIQLCVFANPHRHHLRSRVKCLRQSERTKPQSLPHKLLLRQSDTAFKRPPCSFAISYRILTEPPINKFCSRNAIALCQLAVLPPAQPKRAAVNCRSKAVLVCSHKLGGNRNGYAFFSVNVSIHSHAPKPK